MLDAQRWRPYPSPSAAVHAPPPAGSCEESPRRGRWGLPPLPYRRAQPPPPAQHTAVGLPPPPLARVGGRGVHHTHGQPICRDVGKPSCAPQAACEPQDRPSKQIKSNQTPPATTTTPNCPTWTPPPTDPPGGPPPAPPRPPPHSPLPKPPLQCPPPPKRAFGQQLGGVGSWRPEPRGPPPPWLETSCSMRTKVYVYVSATNVRPLGATSCHNCITSIGV